MAYIIIFIRPTPLPPKTTFSIMWSSGTMPPKGVKVSCMLLTVPVVKDVVVVVNIADWAMPNRTSLPSMLPMDWDKPASANAGFPWLSDQKQRERPIRKIIPIARKILRPSRP